MLHNLHITNNKYVRLYGGPVPQNLVVDSRDISHNVSPANVTESENATQTESIPENS